MKNRVTNLTVMTFVFLSFCWLSGEGKGDDGFVRLFNGRDLTGWKASENGDFSVEDGVIVVRGNRAHLFTISEYQNFDFTCEIMTQPGSNSGIYFHTAYEETWPSKGYEVQVNCTHSDPVKNGSLWGVVKNYNARVEDNEWYTMQITVQGQNIVTRINGKVVVDYTEPAGVTAGRRIGKGSIALQAHDPKSVVRYRNLQVKQLK
ncbi:MAG: glycosyl hydrolase [Planctomycetaceae bacterium]|nr:glycosyl hydrolase [Planctomycetaceae bacterium]MBP62060.1 glycosyl hydrolase [Planctomycetaceae bacterium]